MTVTFSPAPSRSRRAKPSSWLTVICGMFLSPPSGWNWPLPGTAITLMTMAAPSFCARAFALNRPARSEAEWLRPPGTKVL